MTYTHVPRSEEECNTLKTKFEDLGALSCSMVLSMLIRLTNGRVVGAGDNRRWLPGPALICPIVIVTGSRIWIYRIECLNIT